MTSNPTSLRGVRGLRFYGVCMHVINDYQKKNCNCNDLYVSHNAHLYLHGNHVDNKFSIIGYWVRPARATCCFRSRSLPVYTYVGIQNINNRVHPIAVYRILFCIVVIFGLRLLVCFFSPRCVRQHCAIIYNNIILYTRVHVTMRLRPTPFRTTFTRFYVLHGTLSDTGVVLDRPGDFPGNRFNKANFDFFFFVTL